MHGSGRRRAGGTGADSGFGIERIAGVKLRKRLAESNQDVARKVASIEKAPDVNPESRV